MPQRNRPGAPRVGRLILFSLIAWALVALGRAPRSATNEVEAAGGPTEAPVPALVASPRRSRRAPRRLAASFALTVLFFAGASLTAVAGDQAASLFGEEEAVEVAAADWSAADESSAPAEPAPAEAASEPLADVPAQAEPVLAAPPVEELAEAPAPAEPAPAPADEPAHEADPQPQPEVESSEAPAAAAEPHPVRAKVAAPRRRAAEAAPAVKAPPVVVREPEHAPLDPEVAEPGVDATIWLNRTLPDPTPQSLRLTREYASRLVALSRAEGADWSLVLGVLRAETGRPQAPVRPATIAETATRLVELGSRRNAWAAALALTGRTAMSDRAVALARYYRAIGVDALVNGLRAEQERLVTQVLADERVSIYGGGREDLLAGRVDVRVVALISYLAEAYGQVTVSSLVSGHRTYARPGVVSAHVYGAAVDIAALGATPILGHQEPGSVTERAVRDILLLPAELRARQVISLIGMGGPSFALANHHDHIHVGF